MNNMPPYINYDIKRKLKQKIKLKENNKRVNSIRLGVVEQGLLHKHFYYSI